MTVAIRYDSETGRITNRYFLGPKDGSGWVNTDESEWPDPNVTRDELPVYYYDDGTDEITVEGERQVTAGLRVSLDDGTLANDGTDTETVTVTLVNEFVDPEHPFDDIAVLDRSGDITVIIDGQTVTKTLSNGSISFDLTTEQSAGSEVEIAVEHPDVDGSATATIEVIQA